MARTIAPVTATSANWKVMARAWRTTRAPILISLSWRLVSDQSANRAIDSKQSDAVASRFGTFRNGFRKGLDRFRTLMALVWQICLVNQDRRNRP